MPIIKNDCAFIIRRQKNKKVAQPLPFHERKNHHYKRFKLIFSGLDIKLRIALKIICGYTWIYFNGFPLICGFN